MTARFSRPAAAFVLAAALTIGTAAYAHHGWEWAEETQTTLEGTIREIYIGPPHPTLKVETAKDGLWQIDLANPSQTARAGFAEGSARPGHKIVILGNRSTQKDQKLMKAVKITVEGKDFLLYPERIQK
ncbi:MAG: hypothetical protein LCH56_05400 [Proteobacteria bacterium]|nr:hypothetical protein [Pseudomonadota bacterium]